MSVVKPLLWLLEPYIVYKAYLWGARFVAHPLTWEGEVDWFALMLTVLLILDAVALPLVIFLLSWLNPRVRVPDWIHRLGTPIYTSIIGSTARWVAVRPHRLYGSAKPCILYCYSSIISCHFT